MKTQKKNIINIKCLITHPMGGICVWNMGHNNNWWTKPSQTQKKGATANVGPKRNMNAPEYEEYEWKKKTKKLSFQ